MVDQADMADGRSAAKTLICCQLWSGFEEEAEEALHGVTRLSYKNANFA